MLRLTEIKLALDHDDAALQSAVLKRLGLAPEDLLSMSVYRRGYDARQRGAIAFIYTVDVALRDEAALLARLQRESVDTATASTRAAKSSAATLHNVRPTPDMSYRWVAKAPSDLAAAGQQRPIVVGTGPCGLLAGLVLAQMGFKPIILERGKAVRERTQDTWDLWRKNNLHPESNVQFGEGGAGTFSDGKLYSQIKDPRHLGRKVLEEFVKAGAPEEILFVSKPHIGTFRLVKMVEAMRAEITRLGGEIRFNTRVTELLLAHTEASTQVTEAQGTEVQGTEAQGTEVQGTEAEGTEAQGTEVQNLAGQALRRQHVQGVKLADGSLLHSRHVVLAIGHSARDTFEALIEQGVYAQAKPFSIGFRVEHPQGLIDKARFGAQAGHPLLGAADYRLVHHASNGRSVYSFCMCPGGTVVAATSEVGRVVTNGMSQYSRNERNANAAIVVGIEPEDCGMQGENDVLAGLRFQRELESRAFVLGGGDYSAPAQLVGDFVAAKASTSLGKVQPSYKPGVKLADLSSLLPAYAIDAMREAFPAFDKQVPGFNLYDAVLTGVETRTSSPICIQRGTDFQSVNTQGLYPAGEGAGYAGGIYSAAIDGIAVAEAVAKAMVA